MWGGNQKKGRILALFGARVRELRLQRHWTQEELGNKAGRHWTYLGGIERGERNITLSVVADVARALGVQVQDLFSGEEKDAGGRRKNRAPVGGAATSIGVGHPRRYRKRIPRADRCKRKAG